MRRHNRNQNRVTPYRFRSSEVDVTSSSGNVTCMTFVERIVLSSNENENLVNTSLDSSADVTPVNSHAQFQRFEENENFETNFPENSEGISSEHIVGRPASATTFLDDRTHGISVLGSGEGQSTSNYSTLQSRRTESRSTGHRRHGLNARLLALLNERATRQVYNENTHDVNNENTNLPSLNPWSSLSNSQNTTNTSFLQTILRASAYARNRNTTTVSSYNPSSSYVRINGNTCNISSPHTSQPSYNAQSNENTNSSVSSDTQNPNNTVNTTRQMLSSSYEYNGNTSNRSSLHLAETPLNVQVIRNATHSITHSSTYINNGNTLTNSFLQPPHTSYVQNNENTSRSLLQSPISSSYLNNANTTNSSSLQTALPSSYVCVNENTINNCSLYTTQPSFNIQNNENTTQSIQSSSFTYNENTLNTSIQPLFSTDSSQNITYRIPEHNNENNFDISSLHPSETAAFPLTNGSTPNSSLNPVQLSLNNVHGHQYALNSSLLPSISSSTAFNNDDNFIRASSGHIQTPSNLTNIENSLTPSSSRQTLPSSDLNNNVNDHYRSDLPSSSGFEYVSNNGIYVMSNTQSSQRLEQSTSERQSMTLMNAMDPSTLSTSTASNRNLPLPAIQTQAFNELYAILAALSEDQNPPGGLESNQPCPEGREQTPLYLENSDTETSVLLQDDTNQLESENSQPSRPLSPRRASIQDRPHSAPPVAFHRRGNPSYQEPFVRIQENPSHQEPFVQIQENPHQEPLVQVRGNSSHQGQFVQNPSHQGPFAQNPSHPGPFYQIHENPSYQEPFVQMQENPSHLEPLPQVQGTNGQFREGNVSSEAEIAPAENPRITYLRRRILGFPGAVAAITRHANWTARDPATLTRGRRQFIEQIWNTRLLDALMVEYVLFDMAIQSYMNRISRARQQFGLSDREIERVAPETTMPADQDPEYGRDCCICLGQINAGQKMRKLPCKHGMHRSCIDRWLKNSTKCPMCRTDLRRTAASPES